jgi:hypothetical protein
VSECWHGWTSQLSSHDQFPRASLRNSARPHNTPGQGKSVREASRERKSSDSCSSSSFYLDFPFSFLSLFIAPINLVEPVLETKRGASLSTSPTSTDPPLREQLRCCSDHCAFLSRSYYREEVHITQNTASSGRKRGVPHARRFTKEREQVLGVETTWRT